MSCPKSAVTSYVLKRWFKYGLRFCQRYWGGYLYMLVRFCIVHAVCTIQSSCAQLAGSVIDCVFSSMSSTIGSAGLHICKYRVTQKKNGNF